MDIYQERYEAHQKRKKEQLSPQITAIPHKYSKSEKEALTRVFKNRHSQRVFKGQMKTGNIEYITAMMETTPSSCNRRGVEMVILKERNDKDLLSGLLVGGVGWCHRAEYIVMLVANMQAYKNPAEQSNMPYLDAGTMIMAGYLAAEVLGIGCCYINPNIREENKEFFYNRFNLKDKLFCGALAFSTY